MTVPTDPIIEKPPTRTVAHVVADMKAEALPEDATDAQRIARLERQNTALIACVEALLHGFLDHAASAEEAMEVIAQTVNKHGTFFAALAHETGYDATTSQFAAKTQKRILTLDDFRR